jgi:hypothetical protein
MDNIRQFLEEDALVTVSATNYYDLCHNLHSTTDEELAAIIRCKGDEEEENKLNMAKEK